MKDWSNYHPSFQDKLLNDAQLTFEIQKQGFDAHNVIVDGEQTVLIVTEKYNNPDGDLQKIRGDIGSFKVGSIVVDEGITWIVKQQLPQSNPVYQDGTIQKTNNSLKFYIKDANQNSILKEVPCVVTNKIALDLKENRWGTLPEGTIMVICGNTSDSQKILEGQRYILGRSVYKVGRIDDITTPGLLNIKMSWTEKNANDNFATGIASTAPSSTTPTSSGAIF